MTALKYTDRDVRRHPSLLAIAIEYARSYDGDFEPMVDARELALRDGTLDLPVARKVLNCLRVDSDPFVRSLQLEASSCLDDDWRAARPHLRVVPELEPVKRKKERRAVVRVIPTIHAEFGHPVARNGNLHVVAPGGHCVDWHMMDWRWNTWRTLKPRCSITVMWLCGKSCQDPVLVFDIDDVDRPLCRGCQEEDQ